MVVPVFITSCHVSENPKSGPVTAQTITIVRAIKNALADPVAADILFANFLNIFLSFSLPKNTYFLVLHVHLIYNANGKTDKWTQYLANSVL